MKAFDWTPLRDLAANLHISWMGHVVRMGRSPLQSVLRWRDVAWFEGARGPERPKLARVGRPIAALEQSWSNALGRFGVNWRLTVINESRPRDCIFMKGFREHVQIYGTGACCIISPISKETCWGELG